MSGLEMFATATAFAFNSTLPSIPTAMAAVTSENIGIGFFDTFMPMVFKVIAWVLSLVLDCWLLVVPFCFSYFAKSEFLKKTTLHLICAAIFVIFGYLFWSGIIPIPTESDDASMLTFNWEEKLKMYMCDIDSSNTESAESVATSLMTDMLPSIPVQSAVQVAALKQVAEDFVVLLTNVKTMLNAAGVLFAGTNFAGPMQQTNGVIVMNHSNVRVGDHFNIHFHVFNTKNKQGNITQNFMLLAAHEAICPIGESAFHNHTCDNSKGIEKLPILKDGLYETGIKCIASFMAEPHQIAFASSLDYSRNSVWYLNYFNDCYVPVVMLIILCFVEIFRFYRSLEGASRCVFYALICGIMVCYFYEETSAIEQTYDKHVSQRLNCIVCFDCLLVMFCEGVIHYAMHWCCAAKEEGSIEEEESIEVDIYFDRVTPYLRESSWWSFWWYGKSD